MFGFRQREAPALQLYGKLPLAKDYLRLGLGEGAGLAFRDWLDGTFSGGGGREAPVLTQPLRFLLGDDWGGCLQGILHPSSDAGGLRPFPFALVVERQRRAVVDDVSQALATTAAVWRDLAARYQQCVNHPDGRTMLSAMRGVSLDIGSLTPLPAQAVDMEAWLRALWPDSGRAGLEVDLQKLAAVGAGEPLRLPLASGCSQRQQALAWIEILGRLGSLDARKCPTLFLPDVGMEGAESPACLTVFRCPPRPGDGDWLSMTKPGPLGPGDLLAGRATAGMADALIAEGAPSLATSLRLTVTNYLRRRGSGA